VPLKALLPHATVRLLVRLTLAIALLASADTAGAQGICDPDGTQASGSIYRICMPPTGYNGMLVIWAHGFQDAGTPVSIPEDQLCLNGFCLTDLVTSLGFGFATNSYSKTGLAVLQGKDDVLDLVKIFSAQKGKPTKVYLVGASEGGLITALSLEQSPQVFSAGVAACGPIGDFPLQINYFGDARVTFEYFFPGLIPGSVFEPDPYVVANFSDFYETSIKPVVFDPANRHQLDQWVAAAKLPYDAGDYLTTVGQSVNDVLRYSVVNLKDGAQTLGGSPFENRSRWYTGSDNDVLLNIFVPRSAADPAALNTMRASYNTTGVLARPLITLHTLRDQQVPYVHERLYNLKTLFGGSFLSKHLNIPIDRYEHCNFTEDEALFSFAVMLLYDGVLDSVSGTAAAMTPAQQLAFETRARAAGLPTTRAGAKLTFKLKDR
jgi:pimeloyl-ACP methyl ester carboxylesterase